MFSTGIFSFNWLSFWKLLQCKQDFTGSMPFCHPNQQSQSRESINYKVALLRFKVRSTSISSYLHHQLHDREDVHSLRGRSATSTLWQPFTKTTITKHFFHRTAPAIWNSLPMTVLDSVSVTSFKSRLKTRLFSQAFPHTSTDHWHTTYPQRLFSTIQICLLLLLLAASLSRASVSGLCDATFAWTVCRSVRLSVGLSVCKVYCGKMAEWIQMPFGMVSGVG